jgi:hypothetical protein
MQKSKKQPRKHTSGGVRYKITNWNEYNRSLKKRGSLSMWITDDAIESWYYQGAPQQGAQYVYSDVCIEACCILRKVYRLPYRQTEGFVMSIMKMIGVVIKPPDYSVICRRSRSIQVSDLVSNMKGENIYLVVDSTGLKVYGEGEWKVRQHGYGKHRTWRKIHMAVDSESKIILASELTTNSVDDASMVEALLKKITPKIKKFGGDGAYDKSKVYSVLEDGKIKPIIPPQKNARIKQHGNCKKKAKPRDQAIRYIRRHGRKKWKKKTEYHKRSIAETTMFRYKVILGDRLQTRTIDRQVVESQLACKILNQMTRCGMPVSKKAS